MDVPVTADVIFLIISDGLFERKIRNLNRCISKVFLQA